jgi:hypothetical protein
VGFDCVLSLLIDLEGIGGDAVFASDDSVFILFCHIRNLLLHNILLEGKVWNALILIIVEFIRIMINNIIK